MSALAIAPASEPRRHGRSAYANEGLSVEIRGGARPIRGDVMKLGPGGVSVAVDAGAPRELVRGAAVEVRWTPPDAAPFVSRGRLRASSPAVRSRRPVLEIDVAFDPCPPWAEGEHVLDELSWLTAYAPDPLFFREWHHFKISAVGPRTLRAIASARASSLVPGLSLSITVCVPIAGQFVVRAHVVGVQAEVRPGEIDVSLAIDDAPREFLESLGEVVLGACDDATLQSLRHEGFAVRGLTRAMTCGYVESDDDMRQILELRLAAYHSKNKFAFATTAADMLDPYDAYSRQIVCRVGSRIVGAVRLVYVDRERARSEELALGAPLPDSVFDAPFGEISRLCSHPEFRGSDVLIAVLQHVGRVAATSGLPRLLASCDDQCALYEKLGFKKIGVTYDAYGRTGIDVVAVELQDFVDGRGMGTLVWGHVHAPVVDFLARRGIVQPRGLGRVRAAAYRAFQKPIERQARVAMDKARAKKKRTPCCEGCK